MNATRDCKTMKNWLNTAAFWLLPVSSRQERKAEAKKRVFKSPTGVCIET